VTFDIAIVGAGPAGLSVARAMAGSGFSVVLLEGQARDRLAEPAADGREIALTRASIDVLRGWGVMERIDPAEVAPLREARAMNGGSALALRFAPGAGQTLGCFVPNHLIRRALFAAVAEMAEVSVMDGVRVAGVVAGEAGSVVRLADGREVGARLVVAADTRFSELRRAQGIGAQMVDFGKTMMVCRMTHAVPHEGVATEWFGHGITVANLPLNGDCSGIVVTVPGHEAERLRGMDDAAYAAEIGARYGDRLGPMTVVGPRTGYPLVAVFANRFVGPRLVLAGDAAVGMHPVTAHGFNFGLAGAVRLGEVLRGGGEPGAAGRLLRFERGHRAATFPLWAATNAIARLYTDDRGPARLVRGALLAAAVAAGPVRRAIAGRLAAA
jgi:ubiquinone biosynthesis UbiH/UbiF/VisC/COQ6 family hydroxylase